MKIVIIEDEELTANYLAKILLKVISFNLVNVFWQYPVLTVKVKTMYNIVIKIIFIFINLI